MNRGFTLDLKMVPCPNSGAHFPVVWMPVHPA
jgi:hypothetical protein